MSAGTYFEAERLRKKNFFEDHGEANSLTIAISGFDCDAYGTFRALWGSVIPSFGEEVSLCGVACAWPESLLGEDVIDLTAKFPNNAKTTTATPHVTSRLIPL